MASNSDKKFFAKNNAGFLLSADLEDHDAHVGRRKRARLKAGDREHDSELAAEKRPRTQSKWIEDERKASALPKVGHSGEVSEAPNKGKNLDTQDGMGKKKAKRLALLASKKAKEAEKKVTADKKALASASDAVKGKVKVGEVSAAAADMLTKCQKTPESEQRVIALVAERIASNPEKELDLFDVFLELDRKGSDELTRTRALLSAIAVFKDLIPGYRIREPTEQEKSTQRSKQVLALEKHELGLLQAYRRLLPAMEAAMKRDPFAVAPALAALVRVASDFNYRQRLLGTAVKHANSSQLEVRKVLSSGLRDMVEADQRLEASREVVLAIGRLAQGAAVGAKGGNGKGGGGKLHTELIEVMLGLPLGKAESAALQEDNYADADDDIKRGLNESSITQGAEKLRKAEAELLTEVFVVYLRIIRQRHVHGRQMLASALTGLARWGQQVNIELLLEILAEMRGVVQDAIGQCDELVSLQGLRCAMVLLSGPSQALHTDVTWLAEALRNALPLALPSLHSAHSECSTWPPAQCFSLEGAHFCAFDKKLTTSLDEESVPVLVLRCLDAALRCPQAYGRASDAALASLIEQLFILAMSADPHVGPTMLREGAMLLRRHHRLHTLLDVEGGLFGLGGVTDRSISVAWHLQPMAFALIGDVAHAARQLPTAIPRRLTSLADVLPVTDCQSWLASEAAKHIGGLARAPKPRMGPAKLRTVVPFASEAEVGATCALTG